jgi:enoyl-CoA hydratase
MPPLRPPASRRSKLKRALSAPQPKGAFTTIRYEKSEALAWVTLNRPEHLNAYNMRMRDELDQVFDAIASDFELRAMVLSGAGTAFSTGGDMTEFGLAPSPIVARWVRFRRDVWGKLKALSIPTVAAIHGYAVGAGLEMALLCDLAVAAADTMIRLPETGLGMIPGVAGTQTVARRAGLGRGLDLCLTGRWINAQEAWQHGLVIEVVPNRYLKASARKLALGLCRAPLRLTGAAKAAVWEGLDLTLAQGLAHERCLWRITRAAAQS